MILLGSLVNGGAIVVGGLVGMFAGKLLPERLRTSVMAALSLMTIGIAVPGLLKSSNALIPIISMVIGTIIGELLNIDAAIIYAQDGVSDHIDTSLDSPYNTYLHVGLTPTPIANPGLASLQAALNPESHNYYYYVLNPATGMHQFSTTQEEHEQYRAQFAAAAAAASTQSEDE